MDAQGLGFDTALGACAIAWRGEVLLRVRLGTRAAPFAPAEPPAAMASVIERIQALMRGGKPRFDDVTLAFDEVSAFERRVYDVTRTLGPGQTLTYGEVALRLGDPALARAVGQALGHNPWPIVVPCHRVLAADGRIGGFSAPGGARTKLRLLEIEGAWPGGQPSLFEG